MGMWKDFKAFAFKGNVIDLAIAVVIATAFGKIVTVIVDAIIMPLIGKVIPGGAYDTWAPGGIKLGLVIGAVIDFVIIAFVLFLALSALKKALEKPQPPPPPTPPTQQELLLAEIRDLLRTRV